MTSLVLISWAHVMGLAPLRLLLLAAVAYLPLPTATVVAIVLWRQRSRSASRTALFCNAVAAELRAGAVLRDALRAAFRSTSSEEADEVDWFGDIGHIGETLARAMPEIGEELRLTVASASRSGSSTSMLFDELGSYVMALDDVRHEVAMATAPARATAALLIGAPVVYTVASLSNGELRALLAVPAQRIAALTGLVLFAVGLAVATMVLWRARR